VRKHSSKKLQALRKRIFESQQRAAADPTRILGRQTQSALVMLQTGKMVSQLKKACQMLFVSTQISARCCEAFTHAGAFNILFDLLKSCNRSTPHQELLRYVIFIY
jgi:abnormal spindle-like microcephaly-associated protein